jgi:hypothetical protein
MGMTHSPQRTPRKPFTAVAAEDRRGEQKLLKLYFRRYAINEAIAALEKIEKLDCAEEASL